MFEDSLYYFSFDHGGTQDAWFGYTYGDTALADVGTRWTSPWPEGSTYTITHEFPLGYDVSDYYGRSFTDWNTFIYSYFDYESNSYYAPSYWAQGGYTQGPMGYEFDSVFIGGKYESFGWGRTANSGLRDLIGPGSILGTSS